MNILIAGVGGQGTVLASRILSTVGILQDLPVRTMETFGMAQRGGCVVGHIRIGQGRMAAYIPKGQADLLLGFELGEAARNLAWLAAEGRLLVNEQTILPVSVGMGKQEYPRLAIREALQQRKALFIDALALSQKAGSSKAVNIVLLGAAMGSGALPFTEDAMQEALQLCVPAKFLELNRQAYALGKMAAKGGK
ncbi:MAG: indolepyruvate oxidoreductase subunit beta [Clostridia bacterium]|nr:indolepyruvate oxidoreductase subunit beta [Clostridia bacterium]